MAAGVLGASGQRAVCHVVADNELVVESVTLLYLHTVVSFVSAQNYRTAPAITKTAHVNSPILSCRFYVIGLVRPLSTGEYMSVAASVIYSRQ